MTQASLKEQLDALHSFPCKFVFKAIGRTDDEFSDRVVAVVRESLQIEFDPPYEVKQTPGGRHVSVTLEPWVESSDDVIAIFEVLRQVSGLVMLL